MGEVLLRITSCVDCPHHRIENDPDPYDSFCSDDVKVLCTLSTHAPTRTKYGVSSGNPYVTVACRPYQVRKETDVPDWCPLKK